MSTRLFMFLLFSHTFRQSLTSVQKIFSDLASNGVDLEDVLRNGTALSELIRKQQSTSLSTLSEVMYEMLAPPLTAVLSLPTIQVSSSSLMHMYMLFRSAATKP